MDSLDANLAFPDSMAVYLHAPTWTRPVLDCPPSGVAVLARWLHRRCWYPAGRSRIPETTKQHLQQRLLKECKWEWCLAFWPILQVSAFFSLLRHHTRSHKCPRTFLTQHSKSVVTSCRTATPVGEDKCKRLTLPAYSPASSPATAAPLA